MNEFKENTDMAKAKNITEMIEELQRENESLQGLKKLFIKACKDEFGYEPKKIHNIINRYEKCEKTVRNEGEESA